MSRMNYNIPRTYKKMIKNELYQYWDNQKQLKELENDIIDASPMPVDGQPKGNSVGNPTEGKVIKLDSTRSILAVRKRLNYIDNAISRLNEEQRNIVEIIFKEKYNQKMAETYKFISKDTYYNTYNKIIYLVATEYGYI